ncbi:hypothetical protein [Oceanobacillus rekensis]|uniref:hypothetical protein n=1 Tax=Oceanobacillus rekensis TaxID=937927 RepID=UPI000B4546C2|nr:hypothetical protein [Oceanobacillus rekensis]
MRRWTLPLLIILSLVFVITIILSGRSQQTISFFPLDTDSMMEHAETTLQLLSEDDTNTYQMDWKIASLSDKAMYLRQDVSLLFDNGRLRGVQSKWVQNTNRIKMTEKVKSEDSRHFQSISFHHGENHYSEDDIRSVQLMSYNELYVIDSPTTPIASFKIPKNRYETDWKELLDRSSKQQLLFHWHELFHHFDLNAENYSTFPLVELYQYNDMVLPNMTQIETKNAIGRLWEGLYKNYIIPALDPPNDKLDSFMPLVLIDKKNTHLLVLFELNGKKEKLIQRLPQTVNGID